MQIQNQRAEYEATVQTARDDLLKHINSSDALKDELAASKLKNENAERDMVLRETLAATNTTEVLRLSEQQLYNQWVAESKKLENEYATETERRKVEAAEAVRIAISTKMPLRPSCYVPTMRNRRSRWIGNMQSNND